jgi:hypothetical protein
MAKKKNDDVVKDGTVNKNGEHTFYTVYNSRGYVCESLYLERSMDNVDAMFYEHRKKYRNDAFEGNPVPNFVAHIVKRTGVKETHIPYMPLSRQEQTDDDNGDY